MEEVEVEIVLEELPDVPRAVEGLAAHLGLAPHSLGMTSTLDRMVDTEDMALLAKDHSLRVRQKLENIYAGSEFRLTYKYPLEEHERLFIRDEQKLKLSEPDFDAVLRLLSHITQGVSGAKLSDILHIEELAREAHLGPQGAQVNVSIDECVYTLPGEEEPAPKEFVFEIESHGVEREIILKAADWVLSEVGGRLAVQCKYARGLRLLGKL
ncbi:hypothetical protein IIA79_02625 [bacterium]|nr:hypothetical protein [bacterium]